jgi:hypothetical protein
MYVGQTKDIVSRLQHHKSLAKANKGYALHRAFRKYGFSNCYWCLLHENIPTQSEANELEIHEVARLGTLAPQGYNLALGGVNTNSVSKETRQKIGDSLRGRKLPLEVIQKIKNTKKEYPSSRPSKKVRCVETGKTYNSVSKAGSVSHSLKDKNKTAYGYHWEYI